MQGKAKFVLTLVPWLANPLPAQHPAGLLTGVPPFGVQFTTVSSSPGAEYILRIPAESYRGLGEYVPPASFRIRGAILHLRDATVADGEIFDVHVYLEAGQSNLPTILGPQQPGTSAVASVLGLTTPAGIIDHQITVVFPTPVDVPDGKDIFVSLVHRSPGLSIVAIGGSSLPFFLGNAVDYAGPALASGSTYMLLHDVPSLSAVTAGVVGWQPMFELLVDGSSGVAVASRYGSTPPTASMFSSLHPDVADPPHHTARHDVPGYFFRGNGTLPAGSPVFLLGSTDWFASAPWIVLAPGNAVLHLPLITSFSLVMATADTNGNALLMWPVPQSPVLRGLCVSSQAFGLDVGAGAIRGGTAVRQRF